MSRRLLGIFAVAVTVWAQPAIGQLGKPRLPPGQDPGGVAIAILCTGIDYTIPDIAQRLARDGEGELIGWDLVSGDNRPFNANAADTSSAWGGDPNALVKVIGRPGRRVVPVRIDTSDPASLAAAVSFIRQTPARIVVVPMWTRHDGEWAAFGAAIATAAGLLFIVAAPGEGIGPAWPAAFGHSNVLVVGAAANPGAGAVDAVFGGGTEALDPRMAAMRVADTLAGCWSELLQRHRGEALKRAFLAEAAKASAGGGRPVIESCN
jgi:hypothetical protein